MMNEPMTKKLYLETVGCQMNVLDSELVVKQLNRLYKVRDKNLAPLFMRAWNAAQGFRVIKFLAVPRSANREADRLVNAALVLAGHPRKPPPLGG